MIVAKINFIEDICWAAKVCAIRSRDREIVYEIEAMKLIEDCCPSISISKYKGYFQDGLFSLFIE